MEELTILTIAKAVRGKIIAGKPTATVHRVSKDSRQAAPGDLFFPLKGERYDGHTFIPQAVRAGCVSFVVSSETYALELKNGSFSATVAAAAALNIILVKDVNKALRDLASYYIRQFDIKKIAVTGSNGKTTTKDMAYQIFSGRYNTVRSKANMNNEVGLPLSVLELNDDVEAGIFEMGMYTVGEIDMLADIVRPQIGIITNIGTSHIQNFENRDGIRLAKMEIAGYMDRDCTLIINTDCFLLTAQNSCGPYKLIKVGSGPDSDYILSNIENKGENGVEFLLKRKGETARFSLNTIGAHNAINAALAAAAASEAGIGLAESAARLAEFRQTKKITGHNGMKIIDDTYNASPDSVKAALDMLKSVRGKRYIAVLGDMNELGDSSKAYHRLVGAYAAIKGVDALICVGDKARDIAEGAKAWVVAGGDKAGDIADREMTGAVTDCDKTGDVPNYDKARDIANGARAKFGPGVLFFNTKEDAWEKLERTILPGDVILVKGSRGMAMETLVERLLE